MVKQRIQPEVMQSGKGEYEICTFLKHANNPNLLQGFVSTDYRNVQLIFGLLHPVFLCLVWRRRPDGSMVVYKRTHKPRHWSNNVLPCVLSLLCVRFLLWRASAVGLVTIIYLRSIRALPRPLAFLRSFTVRGRLPRVAPLLAMAILSSLSARTTPRFNLFSSNQFFGPQIIIKTRLLADMGEANSRHFSFIQLPNARL